MNNFCHELKSSRVKIAFVTPRYHTSKLINHYVNRYRNGINTDYSRSDKICYLIQDNVKTLICNKIILTSQLLREKDELIID
ncbi:hypothetical protein ACTXT7_002707 [Hymenolepis weldensis]